MSFEKILHHCNILYFVLYFVKYRIHKCIFVFCISNTFVKSISESILKYFLHLYFVFKYYLNVFYPALIQSDHSTMQQTIQFKDDV